MQIEPVGIVRSPVSEAVEENWGDVVAEIHLRPELAPGLLGIDQWSHVMVVYSMHEASFDLKNDLVHRPRGRDDMPELGVFAQRDRERPNGIGVSAAEIIAVADNVLTVRRLDAHRRHARAGYQALGRGLRQRLRRPDALLVPALMQGYF